MIRRGDRQLAGGRAGNVQRTGRLEIERQLQCAGGARGRAETAGSEWAGKDAVRIAAGNAAHTKCIDRTWQRVAAVGTDEVHERIHVDEAAAIDRVVVTDRARHSFTVRRVDRARRGSLV